MNRTFVLGAVLDAVGIRLGEYVFPGREIVLWLSGEEVVEDARVTSIEGCDHEPCDVDPMPVVRGFVAVQEFSRDGRNRGAFEFELEAGLISGTYDATVP